MFYTVRKDMGKCDRGVNVIGVNMDRVNLIWG
jgi:hypothetical protein